MTSDDSIDKLDAAQKIVAADPSPQGFARANALLKGSPFALESRAGKPVIVLLGPVPDIQSLRETKKAPVDQ
jgi:hypothetical protein